MSSKIIGFDSTKRISGFNSMLRVDILIIKSIQSNF